MKTIIALVYAASSGIELLCKKVENITPIKKIISSPTVKRFLKDAVFRTELSLYSGFAVNLIYSVIQLVFGMFYRSLWSGALAVFNMLLAVIRFQLLNSKFNCNNEENIVHEWQKYRTCGIILLFMTPLFASILILVVHKNGGGRYAGPVIYFMAVYTFFAVIISIVNVIRFRKNRRPVLYAAKVINLIIALMSVLSLETAMLTRFDNTYNSVFRQGMTGTSGGAVCLFVLTTAIYMTVHGTKQYRILKHCDKK